MSGGTREFRNVREPGGDNTIHENVAPVNKLTSNYATAPQKRREGRTLAMTLLTN